MSKLKHIFCAVFRHSRIVTNCLGYKYCARCGEQVGDTLAGAMNLKDYVIIGHNCKQCRINYAKLGIVDTLFVCNPFKEKP